MKVYLSRDCETEPDCDFTLIDEPEKPLYWFPKDNIARIDFDDKKHVKNFKADYAIARV